MRRQWQSGKVMGLPGEQHEIHGKLFATRLHLQYLCPLNHYYAGI